MNTTSDKDLLYFAILANISSSSTQVFLTNYSIKPMWGNVLVTLTTRKFYRENISFQSSIFVHSFVLILTRNDGSELKTKAWAIISGGYMGLVSCYALCYRLTAQPDWPSGDCVAVVKGLGQRMVIKAMGMRWVQRSYGTSHDLFVWVLHT
jgi:hypothetical protein